jgi:hypothetical protein
MSENAAEFYRKEFLRCWPWLDAAMKFYGPTHSKEQIWEEIATGRAQLWPMKNAVNLTTVMKHPSGLKDAHAWLAGGDLKEIQAWEPLMCKWAKETEGCDRSIIVGRRGWLKALPGYRELVTTYAKEL